VAKRTPEVPEETHLPGEMTVKETLEEREAEVALITEK
jgi:hypothetical protein